MGEDFAWPGLALASRDVMVRALDEAEQLGSSYFGTEHLLLGLVDDTAAQAAYLLTAAGLSAPAVRAEIRRRGHGRLGDRLTSDAAVLSELGVDVAEIRRRLETQFGAEALDEAACRVARRPWWRGGRHASPLGGRPVLVKRALGFAIALSDAGGEPAARPEHLLYGVLRDCGDPMGTQLGRRARRDLPRIGLRVGAAHPAHLILIAHGVDKDRLCAQALAACRSGL
ncbi:MAG: Clp protease N-terminal domain-containing protein [Pseudonocardiales bacterium]